MKPNAKLLRTQPVLFETHIDIRSLNSYSLWSAYIDFPLTELYPKYPFIRSIVVICVLLHFGHSSASINENPHYSQYESSRLQPS